MSKKTLLHMSLVAEVNVETFKGVFQLTSFLGSPGGINRTVDVARSVMGVNAVLNDMRIK